ncbi:hypothetical protein RhiirA5_404308, partial [Rhizophagus irregularis]
MDVSELNIQESIIMFMTPHEGTISFLILEHTNPEEESGKVCQDDTNMEQVEPSDIVPQNLESEGDTFRSWGDVDGIMEAYSKRHGFTIIKKRLDWCEDGSIKHRSFGRIQTTSCVESHNNIIKRELSANSTLCGLADALDARFEHEAQWNRFFEYRTLSTCVGITT